MGNIIGYVFSFFSQHQNYYGNEDRIRRTDNHHQGELLFLECLALEDLLRHRKQVNDIPTSIIKKMEMHLKSRGIVILSGHAAAGKTSAALELISRLRYKNDLIPIKIRHPDQIMLIDNFHKYVVFIDDIFGSSDFDFKRMTNWDRCLRSVRKMIKWTLWFVITSRKDILREAMLFYLDEVIFSPDNIFNFSSHYEFIWSDMRELLNLSSRSLDTESSLRQITTGNPSHKSGSQNLSDKTLVEFVRREVRALYYINKEAYLAVVLMALVKNNKIEHKYLLPQFFGNNPLIPLVKEITESCNLNIRTGYLRRIREATEYLFDSFFTYDEENKAYEFRDVVFKYAVCIDFGKRQPRRILEDASDEFLQEFVITECPYHLNENLITIQIGDYLILANRVYEMLLRKSVLAAKLRVLNDPKFVDTFIKVLFESNRLSLFLEKTILLPLSNGFPSIIFYSITKPYFLSCVLIQGVINMKDRNHAAEILASLETAKLCENMESIQLLDDFTEHSETAVFKPLSNTDESLVPKDYKLRRWISDFTSSKECSYSCIQKRTSFDAGGYICDLKISSEAYDQLYHITDGQRTASIHHKLSDIYSVVDSRLTDLIEYTLHIYCSHSISKDTIQKLLRRESGLKDKRTILLTERTKMYHSDYPGAIHVHIVLLDVFISSIVELSLQSKQLLEKVGNLLSAEELEKAIYVIDTKDVVSFPEDDISTIETASKHISTALASSREIEINQYSVFFLDEFQLRNRISRIYETQLEHYLNKCSDYSTNEGRARGIVRLQKYSERKKTMLLDKVPHDTETVLSRCPYVSAYSHSNGRLKIEVTENNDNVMKCIKLALKNHPIDYDIHVEPTPESIVFDVAVQQGSAISTQRNASVNDYVYGTLGCLGLRDDGTVVGYTCEHVINSHSIVFTIEGKELGRSECNMKVKSDEILVDALVDFAAIEIDANRLDDCENFLINEQANPVNMQTISVIENRNQPLLEGRILYKKGATTQITFGKYDGMEKRRCGRQTGNNRATRNQFQRMYFVEDIVEGDLFGKPGDSGSIVCHNNTETREVEAVFIYIGRMKGKYVCCLISDALDALSEKNGRHYTLASYSPFLAVNKIGYDAP